MNKYFFFIISFQGTIKNVVRQFGNDWSTHMLLNMSVYLEMTLCVCYKKDNMFLLQTFLAPINQVFPAEDDVNKHVDDNCKSTHSWLLKSFLHFLLFVKSNVIISYNLSCLFFPLFPQVPLCTWMKLLFSTMSECGTIKTTSMYVLFFFYTNLHYYSY